jgi:predicted AAA+ superfamily ATPase
MISCLSDTLGKWKKFFALNTEIIMSEQMQEGLYGELLVLQKLIYKFGEEAVSYWSGADKETHDFYINGSAVEVKTTASKSTEKIRISSEHQLNPSDVVGTLSCMLIW